MAENVKILILTFYAPKERRSSEREARGVTSWQRQRQWASGSGPVLREPDAGSYYLVHGDDV